MRKTKDGGSSSWALLKGKSKMRLVCAYKIDISKCKAKDRNCVIHYLSNKQKDDRKSKTNW